MTELFFTLASIEKIIEYIILIIAVVIAVIRIIWILKNTR